MSELDIIGAISQVGFPIAAAAFLLWKGYTQDQKYLERLEELSAQIQKHIEQTESALQILKQDLDCFRAKLLEQKRYGGK